VMSKQNNLDTLYYTVTVNVIHLGLGKPNGLESSFLPTWTCDWDGSCTLRCAWRRNSRRIRWIGAWRIDWRRNRRTCRSRSRRRSRHGCILPMVLPSLLVSILPAILLSAVLSDNVSPRLSAVRNAMGPSACLRILVDTVPRFVSDRHNPLGYALQNCRTSVREALLRQRKA